MVYISYENGLLRLRFDDFKSNDIKNIEYISGKLNISNYSGYFYSLNFLDLTAAKIVFADGIYKNIKISENINTITQLLNAGEWIIGTSGADQFSTNNSGSRVFGGAGDDLYIVSSADKNTIITDYSGNNTLDLSGYKIEDIKVSGGKAGLEIKYTENDEITIDGIIQNFKFSNDITLTQDQFLIGREVAIQGTNESETLSGYLSNDIIYAGGGDDILNGNQGDDVLMGGNGNDILNGGVGNDKYIFSLGNGVDIINDFSGQNEIIIKDVQSKNVFYTIDGGTLNIHYSNNDIIKIQNFLANNRDNFSIEFSDGKKVSNKDFDAEVGIQYWVRNLVGSTNTSADFKYAFPISAPNYISNTKELNGWDRLGSSAQDYVLSRFNQLSSATGLTFQQTDNLEQKNVISVQNNIQSGSSGYAFFPSNSYIGSDIFFNVDYSSEPLKSWQQYVYPHEIGHALGLRHSFEGPKKELFSSLEESSRWTVMSYNTVDYTDGNFKAFDYAALQAMYGMNQSARSGNDVYRFDNKIGTLVWDGNGNDTIDASDSTLKAYINLKSGAWSYLGEKSQYISSSNQLAINLSTVIENAIGTDFNDTLIGNHYDNVVDGGSGDDLLFGGGGNDVLDGGSDRDKMIGGLGNDIYYVDHIYDNVVENIDEGYDVIYSTVSYHLGGRHVEELDLVGLDNINGTGNTKDNILVGNTGNNILDGGAGRDKMIGGLGNDVYYVDHIYDSVVENIDEGYDVIYSTVSYHLGGRHVEELDLVGLDNINGTGNTKDNMLVGNTGNNILDGGAGRDKMIGGLGNDVYYVDHIYDNVVENIDEGYDVIYSTVSYHLGGRHIEELNLVGFDNINGTGNTKDNILMGNAGSNILDGGAGNDILNGGAGNDFLIGSQGLDIAIFKLLNAGDATGGNGVDTWLDFKLGNTLNDFNADMINISELLIDFDRGKDINSFISITKDGNDTFLNIDRDGLGQDYHSAVLLNFKNLDTTLLDLLNNHQLIV